MQLICKFLLIALVNIKCDSASYAPTFPLNNGVSIVQKLVKTVKRFDNVIYTC